MSTERKDETANAALLRDIVGAYTVFSDDIDIKSDAHARGETLSLRVHKEDYPKVAGKWQKQIESLRTVFKFIGARDQIKIRILLLEPEPLAAAEQKPRETDDLDDEFSRRFNTKGFAEDLQRQDSAYDPDGIRALLDKILARIMVKPYDTDIYEAEGKVQLDAHIDKEELQLADGVAMYLHPIFRAVGHSQGKDLYLSFNPRIVL